jgi:hypothetical protein
MRNSTKYFFAIKNFETVQRNISISETVRNRTNVHTEFFA